MKAISVDESKLSRNIQWKAGLLAEQLQNNANNRCVSCKLCGNNANASGNEIFCVRKL